MPRLALRATFPRLHDATCRYLIGPCRERLASHPTYPRRSVSIPRVHAATCRYLIGPCRERLASHPTYPGRSVVAPVWCTSYVLRNVLSSRASDSEHPATCRDLIGPPWSNVTPLNDYHPMRTPQSYIILRNIMQSYVILKGSTIYCRYLRRPQRRL